MKENYVKVSEIGKNLGLSNATVSRALRGNPLVTDQTRKRVENEAHRLGYKRNDSVSKFMSNLRTGKIRTNEESFAYLVTIRPPWRQTNEVVPIFYLYYEQIKAQALALGYKVEILWRNSPQISTPKITKLLQNRGIRGVIVAPRPRPYAHIHLDWDQFTAVAIGHPLPIPGIHTVSSAHPISITKALRYLRKRGYHRIGLAIPKNSDQYASQAYSAHYWSHYHSSPSKNQIPICFFQHGLELSHLKVKRSILNWYKQYKPDLIISAGTYIYDLFQQNNIAIPQNVGYFNLTLPSAQSEISGIYENIEEISHTAINLLVEQLHRHQKGVTALSHHHTVEGTIICGTTA